MSEFLYYLPSEKSSNCLKLDKIKEFGLGHVFDKDAWGCPCNCGPDDMIGCVFSVNDAGGHMKYNRDKQTWCQIGDAWLGYWTDKKPKPEELLRDTQIDGEWVAFPDGQNWLVPHARKYVDDGQSDAISVACTLPQRLTFEDGKWFRGGVQSQYAEVWQHIIAYEQAIADAIADGDIQDGMVRFNYEHISEMAVAGLTVNYRIGAHELNALEVFDENTRSLIIDAMRDQKTYMNWAKKKALELVRDGGSSLSGQDPTTEDIQSDTHQPQPTTTDGKRDSTADTPQEELAAR